MTGIHIQYSCARSVVSVQSRYTVSLCTAIMYPYSTRTVVCSTRTRQWLMRCAVRAASAQIEIEDYGDRYEGQVNQYGQRHGKGVFSLSNGERYVGEFSEGKKHGKGVVSYSDGERYVGEFSEGRYHGHGICTDADGYVQSGKWENDNFLG